MIGITGATGQIGGLVATLLAGAGVHQRLLVRNPDRAPRLTGADVVAFSGYADGDAAARVLSGVEILLMVSAAEAADRVAQHVAFIDAAAAAGVRHILYTSFFGASPAATFTLARDHWATEEHIRSSGMRFTFLQDNLYLDVLPLFAGEGVIRGPAGDGAVSAVARADVARVVAQVLREPIAHRDATYELTGPESLTLAAVARIVSDVTGHPLRYQEETIEEAYASRAGYEAPPWQVDAWVSTYAAIRNGELARVTDDVVRVTGTPPLRLRDLLARPS